MRNGWRVGPQEKKLDLVRERSQSEGMKNATTLVYRETRLGRLLVTILDGELAVVLGGKTLAACVREGLPADAPTAGPLGAFGGTVARGTFGGVVLLYTAEIAAIRAAQESARVAYVATLPGKRAALTTALADCERGAFPGSAAHKAESAALKALEVFDLAHPEVVAALHGTKTAQSGETSLEGAL